MKYILEYFSLGEWHEWDTYQDLNKLAKGALALGKAGREHIRVLTEDTYFAIQENFARHWEKPRWEAKPERYDTAGEAKAVMEQMPRLQRINCRVAEAYTVTTTRYKEVHFDEP